MPITNKKTLIFQYACQLSSSMYLGFQSRFQMINLPSAHDFCYKATQNLTKQEELCFCCHKMSHICSCKYYCRFNQSYISSPVNRGQFSGQHLCVNLFIPFGSSSLCMNETVSPSHNFSLFTKVCLTPFSFTKSYKKRNEVTVMIRPFLIRNVLGG